MSGTTVAAPVVLRVGDETIWGRAEYVHAFPAVPGVFHVGTAGHGGFMVTAEAARRMPRGLWTVGWPVLGGAWYAYEEDCAWCAVVLAFPAVLEERSAEDAAFTTKAARATLDHCYPRHANGQQGCGVTQEVGARFHRCVR